MPQALITSIQRFSLHDGPGIRTTVFFQGCNLRCAWCHNPESIPRRPVLMQQSVRCVGCGRCASVCPHGALSVASGVRVDRRACQNCGACAAACPSGALAMSSRLMEVDDIAEAALRDRPFYDGSGGVTVSGGEPMMQRDAVAALLKLLHAAGVHTALDTAAQQPFSAYEPLLGDVDLLLVDYKLRDEAQHRRWTGTPNARIRQNLRRFSALPVELWVRVPVIPGANAGAEALSAIADDLVEMDFRGQVELLPFHALGESKYQALGRKWALSGTQPPTDDQMQAFRQLFKDRNLTVREEGK